MKINNNNNNNNNNNVLNVSFSNFPSARLFMRLNILFNSYAVQQITP